MKKLLYISFIFAFILAFTSCEKEVIKPCGTMDEETDVRMSDKGDSGYDVPYQTRGGDGTEGGGEVVDPDEDEDFDEDDDQIVDPDEDEDFNQEENIVDPNEDEDFEGEEETEEGK